MDWKIEEVKQDTNHRFLNEFTLNYSVKDGDSVKPYSYFAASRNDKDHLRAITKDYSRPDGVIMCLYYVDPTSKEVSILFTTQFRPAMGTYMTSFPAGLMDKEDNSPSDTATREALEEAGAIITDIEELCPASPTSSGLSDEMNAFLLARIVSFKRNDLEAFEDISTRLVPLSEVKAMLKDSNYIIPLPTRLCCLYVLERFK